jgi:hypothetical protein
LVLVVIAALHLVRAHPLLEALVVALVALLNI